MGTSPAGRNRSFTANQDSTSSPPRNLARTRPTYFRHPVAAGAEAVRRARGALLDVARRVRDATDDPEQRVRLWAEWSGQSRATLYRRLADLRQLGESDPASER